MSVDGKTHTPGPWRVVSAGFMCADEVAAGFDKHHTIKYYVELPVPSRISAHNARLIAAAPDLLAACEAFEAANTVDECQAAFDLTRAAIAKAKGA